MARSQSRSVLAGLVVPLAVFWLWLPALVLLWWCFLEVATPGIGPWHTGLWRWWDSWYGVGSGWRWQYLVVGGLGTMFLGFRYATMTSQGWPSSTRGIRPGDSRPLRATGNIVGIAGLVLTVLSVVMFVRAVWDNDKDLARFYGRATTIFVPDLTNPPAAVASVVGAQTPEAPAGGGAPGGPAPGHRCEARGPAASDVPACIRRGTLPQAGFQPRVGSLDGARSVMTRSSGNIGNIRLLGDTLTYLNATGGRPAAWSAIRDGTGIDTPMYGVVEWKGGTQQPTQCRFSGRYRVDRAFHGSRSNSLPNLLNDRYPRLIFQESDAWGYCRGNEPVVVLPVQRQIHAKNRTVTVPAGIVILRGSPSGAISLERRTSVRPGELPGPVYADGLVARQRDAIRWSGGRELHDRQKFGFESTDSPVQEGNVNSYLLRRADTGRLYWVSPQKPRSSDSQQFVAYDMVPADTVTDGQLNPLDLYVLGDDDPRIINIDQLAAAATDYIASTNPGLLGSGGKLVEFLPVQGDVWQGYVEIRGRVVYRLTISYAHRIPTELVALEDNGTGTAGVQGATPATAPPPSGATSATTAGCGQAPARLTDRQLADCIRSWAEELSRREQSG